ncbi:uncharacterized protein LOC134713816 isoform X2 [Mytilus trossulus]|uniref:uncharacterized protein LOC134713816 isoform X2 n=1 Tax=Mytilus trossulus TaxID=6551 RepID=UPI0030045419
MIEIIVFIIILIALVVIGWLRSQNDDNSSKVKDDEDNANPKLQIWEDDENVLQHTNRVTHLHQHNYSDQRVVNNNLFLSSSKADVIKRNVAITRKRRTTELEYIMNDTERLRCFDSRKVTLFKKAAEVKTKTRCDIYLEMRYERKPHIYKSETFQNYSLKQEDMDVTPSDETTRSNNKQMGKRRIEYEDVSDTEDNKVPPAKIQKVVKKYINNRNRDQTENEMETEADECCCNICEAYEDDNDNDKGPWVYCDFKYDDLSCCTYTAHVTCLDMEEYPQHFLCPEHIE